MHDIAELYTAAQNGEDGVTTFTPYRGTQIGIAVEGQDLLYVWLVPATDTDELFDITSTSLKQFERDLDDWLEAVGALAH